MSADATIEEKVEAEVVRLLDLHEGPRAIASIVSLGEQAIPALERVLRGPSQALHHSRCWAADTLAAIGSPLATQTLVRALNDSIRRAPAALSREAEDVVVSCIAEHLGNTSELQVVDALLSALETRAYPGCVRALGRIGSVRAIPLLVRCLFEDVTRESAAEALRRLGRTSLPAITTALHQIQRVNGREPPSHIDGRAAAAALLGTLVSRDPSLPDTDRARAREGLRRALHDSQRAVRIAAALALIQCQDRVQTAIRVLVRALDEPDRRRLAPMIHTLIRLGDRIEPALFEALTSTERDERAARRRQHAVWIAGQLGTPAAVRVLSSMTVTDTPLRLALVAALARSTSTEPATLERYLTDPTVAIRRRALLALQRRHAVSVQSALRLLADPDPEVRQLAATSLAERPEDARPALSRAVLLLGVPLHGIKSRLRLSWYAARWLLRRHS